jgi:hypothetical protein
MNCIKAEIIIIIINYNGIKLYNKKNIIKMKVRSNIKLPYDSDRSGIHTAIIEIDLVITSKDPLSQTYALIAKDYTINDERYVTPGNSYLNPGGRTLIDTKYYFKTYAEYDAERDFLLSIDTSGLTGSLLEDKLLQDALLYSANNDTVYSSSYGDWVAYSEPIPVVEPVATGTTQSNPPDPLIPTGTSGTTVNPGTSGTTVDPGTSGTTAGTSGTTVDPGTSGTTVNPGTSGTTVDPGTSGTTAGTSGV